MTKTIGKWISVCMSLGTLMAWGQTTRTLDVDVAFPSGGSRAPLVYSAGGTATVVLDNAIKYGGEGNQVDIVCERVESAPIPG